MTNETAPLDVKDSNPAGSESQGTEAAAIGAEVKKIEMTEDDFTKRLNSEADRRVTQAMITAKQKADEEKKRDIEIAVREAQRLAAMTADEQMREMEKRKSEMLAEKEAKIRTRELELFAVDYLSEQKLPIEFKPFVIGMDEDTTKLKASELKGLFDKAVQAEVDVRLRAAGASQNQERKAPVNAQGKFDGTKTGTVLDLLKQSRV
jgi:hypothetical protein